MVYFTLTLINEQDLLLQKGEKEYPFQIGEVNEGMYLLLIESDKGERVTQRIIKK